MKFIKIRAVVAIILILLVSKNWAIAQSPEAWGLETGQTTIFNGGKYYLVLAQPIGNQFEAIGVDTGFNIKGTYERSGFEVVRAKLAHPKDMSLTYDYAYVIFSATNTRATLTFYGQFVGRFTTSYASWEWNPPSNPLSSPLGNMLRAAGTAPTMPNLTYTLSITDGSGPFTNQGNLTFTPAAGGTYTITSTSNGLASSSGTYHYAVTNTVAGCFNISDSLNGNSTTYFCYYTPTNGFFMLTQTNGGYQVGTFTASSQTLLPAFFNGSTNVASNATYLQFTNGTPFGYYNAVDFTFPLFYHYEMGFEWFFDAQNSANGAYLYDFASQTYFYTDPSVFPYLYDFTLNSWLYYYPDSTNPGHYTSNPRWFYDFSHQQYITK